MAARGAYLVYRIETRTDAALPSLRRHVRGGFSATTLKTQDLHQLAHGSPGGAVPLRPSAAPAHMRQWRKDAKDMRGAGKPPAPWCEAVFVGAKIIDWPPERGRKWGEACVGEFQRLFPEARIIEAQLHTREAEWHVHVVAQPRGRDHRGKTRCSKNAMLRSAIGIETGTPLPIAGRRSAEKHRDDCTELQSAFHRACGEPFGLLRGEQGSTAKHEEIDSEKRAAAAAREVEELARRRDAELARIGNFKAALAALARDRAALEKRIAEVEAREAKAKAAALANRKRAIEIVHERNKHVEAYNARVDEYVEARDSLRRRRKAVASQIEVLDACADSDLGIEDARDAIHAVGRGKPMPPAAKRAIEERRARAAAAAKRHGQQGIPETDATRELAEIARRGARTTSV